jgi:hypothetical protein
MQHISNTSLEVHVKDSHSTTPQSRREYTTVDVMLSTRYFHILHELRRQPPSNEIEALMVLYVLLFSTEDTK